MEEDAYQAAEEEWEDDGFEAWVSSELEKHYAEDATKQAELN